MCDFGIWAGWAEELWNYRSVRIRKQAIQKKAGDGNRTHLASLEGWCFTTKLHPHL
jgi:hypothetical protein